MEAPEQSDCLSIQIGGLTGSHLEANIVEAGEGLLVGGKDVLEHAYDIGL